MKLEQGNNLKSKQSGRLAPILLFGAKSFLVPATSILFSFLIIRFSGKNTWGEFVPFLLFFYVANIVTNWGSKDFLMRAFGKSPHKRVSDWQTLFVSRLPVLLAVFFVVFVFFQADRAVFISGWIVCAYVSNAVFPIINDQRDYLSAVIIELLAFSGVAGFLLTQSPVNLDLLIILFTCYQLGRAFLFWLRYVTFFRFKNVRFDLGLLIVNLPFFLLALSGFLQSKFDLYVFERFATSIELANYQIISGFLVFAQALAAMILTPYMRNIYRMKGRSLKKVVNLMIIAGIPIQLLSIGAIYFILFWFFDIKPSLIQLGLFLAISYPSFAYAVHVFYAYSQEKEKEILIVSLISAAANGLMSIILLSFGMSITGVLIANAIGQIVALIGYRRNKLVA